MYKCFAAQISFIVITTVILLSFGFALYHWHVYSKQSIQLTECQVQLQNQTTQVQDADKNLKICKETLRKGCAKAKKDNDDQCVQLVTTNHSLSKSPQQWETCEKELNTWINNNKILMKEQKEMKHKLQECQAQLQNQTAQIQAQAAFRKSTEELKKDLEKAKKAGDDLHAQLVAANENFDKNQQLRDSCQKELNNLHDSVSIQTIQQEAEKLKLQEQIKSLQQHLQDKSQTISKMENEMKWELPQFVNILVIGLFILLFLCLCACNYKNCV